MPFPGRPGEGGLLYGFAKNSGVFTVGFLVDL